MRFSFTIHSVLRDFTIREDPTEGPYFLFVRAFGSTFFFLHPVYCFIAGRTRAFGMILNNGCIPNLFFSFDLPTPDVNHPKEFSCYVSRKFISELICSRRKFYFNSPVREVLSGICLLPKIRLRTIQNEMNLP